MPDLAALMIRPEEVASYIIFTDGARYYAKNGLTGRIDFSGTDAATVIQNAVNSTKNGRVFVRGIPEPSGIKYKPGVSVWYDTPHLYIRDVPTLELVSEIDTEVQSTAADNGRNVVVDNDILYAISNAGRKFVVYDVRDPHNPVKISELSALGVNIAKIGDFIVYSTGTGLAVLDVSNPKYPSLVTGLNLGDWVHGIRVYGKYIFAAMHTANKLVIADFSDVRNPVKISELSGNTYFHGAHDVVVEGRWAYVANHLAGSGEYGLALVCTPNPYSPWIGYGYQPNVKFSYVEKHGGLLFVGTHTPDKGLWIYDVRDPANVKLVKTVLTDEVSAGYWMDFYGDWLVVMSPDSKNIHLLNLKTLEVDYTLNVPDAHQLRHIFVYRDMLFVSLNKYVDGYYRWFIRIYRFRHDNAALSAAKTFMMKQEKLAYSQLYYVKRRNSGTATFSGDGTTTQFAITHGLASTPKVAVVTPASADARGSFHVTVDSSKIYVNYATAPPAGTNNVALYWYAEI